MANEWYQQNSHKWQTWPLLTVGLPVTSERYWASFQVTRLFHNATVSQCDQFLLLHIYIYMYLLFETSPGWLPGWRVFIIFFYLFFLCVCVCVCGGGGGYLDLVGEHSAPMYLLFGAVYWSLGHRGYFRVSNVAFVSIRRLKYTIYIWSFC